MTKKYHLELRLVDEGDFVKVAMKDGEGQILDYENTEAKQVRVIAPLPNRTIFIEQSEYWVQEGLYGSIEESIDSYLASRKNEIFDQVQEIRKSIKRIKRTMEAMKIAKNELQKYQGNKT